MPSARPTFGRPSVERYRLTDVPIFEGGEKRGKKYSDRDLDDVVRNWRRFGRGPRPLLRNPAVLGHADRQHYLEQEGLPAAAWVCGLRRVGHRLHADFEDIPPQVCDWIRGKQYRHVSAEIYDDVGAPEVGLPGKGMGLRRVAFLGADPPAVKGLGELPEPERYVERSRTEGKNVALLRSARNARPEHFSERRFAARLPTRLRFTHRLPLRGGGWACFSEVTVDRDAMLAELAKHGADAEALGEAPDSALSEMLRICQSKDEQGGAGGGEEEDQYDEDGEDVDQPLAAPEGEEQQQQYRERGNRFRERAERYAALHARYQEYCDDEETMTPHAEGADDVEQASALAPEGPPMPKKRVTATTEHYSEAGVRKIVRAAVAAALKGDVGELVKARDEIRAEEKTRGVEAFCERMAAAGKLPPVEYAPRAKGGPGGPTFRRLLRADSRRGVEKFSEKDRAPLSELELQQREIEQRPTMFGERFKEPARTGGQNPGDADRAPAIAFFREHGAAFSKAGTAEADFVKAFEKASPEEREKLLGK